LGHHDDRNSWLRRYPSIWGDRKALHFGLDDCGSGLLLLHGVHSQFDHARIQFRVGWTLPSSAKLQVKFSFLNSIAKDAKIKRELLEQLMESLEDAVEIEKINRINKADFLSDVPANLRFKVTENIYDGVANKVLIFKDRDPDLVSNMIPKMTPMKIKKNEYVYKQGQFSSAIYLLFNGRVVEMDNDINFREYSVGSYFGEVEIFKNAPRKHNVKTLEDCQLMAIDRNDLLDTLKFYPELKIDLITIAIIKDMKTKQTLNKIKDLRSLIRVDEFWRIDDFEFNKSVSEKIQGLYFFHKKKYENYLKKKQVNRNWFKDKTEEKINNVLHNNGSNAELLGPGSNHLSPDDRKLRNVRAEMRRDSSNIPVSQVEPPSDNDPRGNKTKAIHADNYLVPPAEENTPRSLLQPQPQPPNKDNSHVSDEGKAKLMGMNAQALEDLNKKMISDLAEKVEIVKKNFTQSQSECKKIGDKVTEVEGLLIKLLSKKSQNVLKEDQRANKVIGHKDKQQEFSSSIDLSGDDPVLKKGVNNRKEEVDSFFESFDGVNDVGGKSERTITKGKISSRGIGAGVAGGSVNTAKLAGTDRKSKSSIKEVIGPVSNASRYKDNFLEAMQGDEDNSDDFPEGNRLEMIKEADEMQEKYSSTYRTSQNHKQGDAKKSLIIKKPANKSQGTMNKIVGSKDTKDSRSKGSKKEVELKESSPAHTTKNNFLSNADIKKPPKANQQTQAQTSEYPQDEMRNLLKEINSQVISKMKTGL
jgi:CRP-like cAMP-binding protein